MGSDAPSLCKLNRRPLWVIVTFWSLCRARRTLTRGPNPRGMGIGTEGTNAHVPRQTAVTVVSAVCRYRTRQRHYPRRALPRVKRWRTTPSGRSPHRVVERDGGTHGRDLATAAPPVRSHRFNRRAVTGLCRALGRLRRISDCHEPSPYGRHKGIGGRQSSMPAQDRRSTAHTTGSASGRLAMRTLKLPV